MVLAPSNTSNPAACEDIVNPTNSTGSKPLAFRPVIYGISFRQRLNGFDADITTQVSSDIDSANDLYTASDIAQIQFSIKRISVVKFLTVLVFVGKIASFRPMLRQNNVYLHSCSDMASMYSHYDQHFSSHCT
jgi:hypothetical protein